jgi:hypothetical protein
MQRPKPLCIPHDRQALRARHQHYREEVGHRTQFAFAKQERAAVQLEVGLVEEAAAAADEQIGGLHGDPDARR